MSYAKKSERASKQAKRTTTDGQRAKRTVPHHYASRTTASTALLPSSLDDPPTAVRAPLGRRRARGARRRVAHLAAPARLAGEAGVPRRAPDRRGRQRAERRRARGRRAADRARRGLERRLERVRALRRARVEARAARGELHLARRGHLLPGAERDGEGGDGRVCGRERELFGVVRLLVLVDELFLRVHCKRG